MGDPAGIGPEIVTRALSRPETYEKCRPIVTGDVKIIRMAVDLLGLNLKVRPVGNVNDALFEYGTIDVFDIDCINLDTFEFGKVNPQCGNAAFLFIKKAIDLAMADEVDATVTAPLNKEALNLAGHHFDGHTEMYATFTNTKKYAMLLADEFLRVIHVSTHVPLRKACDLVKKQRIIEVTELIDDAWTRRLWKLFPLSRNCRGVGSMPWVPYRQIRSSPKPSADSLTGAWQCTMTRDISLSRWWDSTGIRKPGAWIA